MNKKILIAGLLLLFIISFVTFLLIIKYINPYSNGLFIMISFLLSFVIFVSTFFALVFFFIKKIHYRGETLISHVTSSFRQGLFVALFFVGIGIFFRIEAPMLLTSMIIFLLFIFLELLIQNINN